MEPTKTRKAAGWLVLALMAVGLLNDTAWPLFAAVLLTFWLGVTSGD